MIGPALQLKYNWKTAHKKNLSLLSQPIRLSNTVPCKGVLCCTLLTKDWLILVNLKDLSAGSAGKPCSHSRHSSPWTGDAASDLGIHSIFAFNSGGATPAPPQLHLVDSYQEPHHKILMADPSSILWALFAFSPIVWSSFRNSVSVCKPLL